MSTEIRALVERESSVLTQSQIRALKPCRTKDDVVKKTESADPGVRLGARYILRKLEEGQGGSK